MGSTIQLPRTNLIIGGNFDTNPWQRGTTFTGAVTGTYTADRWYWNQSGAGVVDILKTTGNAPSIAQAGIFTQNCLNIDVTTADAAIAAGDNYSIRYIMEGYDFAQIAQTSFTISFWHNHTITGTYCVGFVNSGSDRNYIAEYTQTTTNTWEYTQIVVPASPSAGTWDYTTGAGLYIIFSIAAGSTYQGAANIWQAGNLFATANQVNGMSANTNFSKIQLVQVRPGSQTQPWEQRTEAQELALCQRYCEVMTFNAVGQSIGNGIGDGATSVEWFLAYKAVKRGLPTFTFAAAAKFSVQNSIGIVCATIGANAIGVYNSNCFCTVAAGALTGLALLVYANDVTATITVSAEL